ncbi:HxlR family transcriptional regulator [Photobacterium proteolyticum]|uniref:HxlR family transcriptional regulator n=1 Tax=Photobacterium proteolyticum TaxID=1903952 RepID=A0A1Q9H1P4_9GAMM|nr:winged helix-turn-helix transcriptional regulator [Photobacterium proteolyticum]OLQ81595.1 HxlR family transcriptional regulator [Photobacterium proteolyticum]
MSKSQFCPVSKAMEILGERWTILLIRELVLGSTRFNQLQRGLRMMSPSLLTRRLSMLVDEGLVIKRKIPGQKGYEYFPSESCMELLPVIEHLSQWGMRWARGQMDDDDLDLDLLMLHLPRNLNCKKLVGRETVIRFNFDDVHTFPSWWLVVEGEEVDVCVHEPGKEVDVYMNTSLRTMTEIWMGDTSYKQAMADKKLTVVGIPLLTKNIDSWMPVSAFAGIRPALGCKR